MLLEWAMSAGIIMLREANLAGPGELRSCPNFPRDCCPKETESDRNPRSLLVGPKRRCSIKFSLWGGLLSTDPPGDNFSLEVVLPLDRAPGQPTQHRDLSNVRQRVRDRPLE